MKFCGCAEIAAAGAQYSGKAQEHSKSAHDQSLKAHGRAPTVAVCSKVIIDRV
jgi:hypothetical protein